MAAALVLGGGSTVWSDVEAALRLGEFAAVVTCNDVTAAWPGPIAAAASLHAEHWPNWLAPRRQRGLPEPARLFGHAEFVASPLRPPAEAVEYVCQRFDGQRDTGSSGLFALKIALVDLGYARAVLCGVPMDDRPHFFDDIRWAAAAAHRAGWAQALPVIGGRARSMSGWTAELLGRPDEEWLAEAAA